jgi:DNA-binding transcriptional LysR family regulator
VSQALRQLRGAFDDELLVTVGRKVELTGRAELLLGPLSQALLQIDSLVQQPRPFEPSTQSARFTIATVDYACMMLAAPLLQLCANRAPYVGVDFVLPEIHGPAVLARLEFIIAPRAAWPGLGKRTNHMQLWQDEIVCIAGEAHRNVAGRITPQEFQRTRHIGFHLPWATSQLHSRLQPTAMLETQSVCTVSSFLALADMVAKTNCLALVPRKVAQPLARERKIRIIELEYAKTKIVIDAYWNARFNGNPSHIWFRELMKEAASSID